MLRMIPRTTAYAYTDIVQGIASALDYGVDTMRICRGRLPGDLISQLVARDVYLISELSEYKMLNMEDPSNFDYVTDSALVQILDNLRRFVSAGGKVALGDPVLNFFRTNFMRYLRFQINLNYIIPFQSINTIHNPVFRWMPSYPIPIRAFLYLW